MTTPLGHRLLYTCAADNSNHADEFTLTPIDPVANPTSFSGFFTLTSVRTGQGVTFGADPTPSGSQRVFQDPAPSRLYFT
ncbi:hypothetical protein AB0383_23660 [Amycolatopsis sp. NPDC051373]|uniref:hypothetical protein n=1 Tax=Amycolatopsis sp. NPDC051373 TaxID=3155801 RepID=UPI00344BF819